MKPVLKIFILIFLCTIYSHAQINNGLWSTNCKSGQKKEQIYDKNNRVNTLENFYQDAQCTNASFSFQTIGTVKYYEDSTEFIDFTYEEIYLTIFRQNVIDDFNQRKVCGFENWKISEAQNITGLKCAIFNVGSLTQIPSAGDIKYGIFHIENNRLRYGKLSKNFDGTTPEKRPTEFNPLTEYIFQNSL